MSGRQAALAVALASWPRWRWHRTTGRCRAAAATAPGARRRAAITIRGRSSSSAARTRRLSSERLGLRRRARSGYEPTPAQRRHPRAGTGTGAERALLRRAVLLPGSYGYRATAYVLRLAATTAAGAVARVLLAVLLQRLLRLLAVLLRSRGVPRGLVRVLVEPTETRVYVDGYYAGVVDDFDGIFQRLNLVPGPPRHLAAPRRPPHAELQGLRAVRPDDQDPPRHGAGRADRRERSRRSGDPKTSPTPGAGSVRRRTLRTPDEPLRRGGPRRRTTRPAASARGELGTLRLDVRPSDASIYVDGAFRGTGRLRSLRLPPGRHRIEVVRPGYRTLEQRGRGGARPRRRGQLRARAHAARPTRLAAAGASTTSPRRPLVEVLVDAAGDGRREVAAARPHERPPARSRAGPRARRTRTSPRRRRCPSCRRPRRRGRTRWRRCPR